MTALATVGIVEDFWPPVLQGQQCPLCGGVALARDDDAGAIYICADVDDYGRIEPGCQERFRFSSPLTVEQDLRVIKRASVAASSMRRRTGER